MGRPNKRRENPSGEIVFMDADLSNHPTPEKLRAYALGKLDDAVALLIRVHLAECGKCRRQMTALAPGILHELEEEQTGAQTSVSHEEGASIQRSEETADVSAPIDSELSP